METGVAGFFEAAGDGPVLVYVLDFETGDIEVGPGFIDFVPSPDGRFFVTPAPLDGTPALQFFDASEVFDAAGRGVGCRVARFYEDRAMRDQYPSVGILPIDTADSTTRSYRVLTAWFERVKFPDYEVRWREPGSRPRIRPLARPVPACPDYELSLPIMSPDGSKLAARDERTATTKLFRLHGDGRCEEVLDLGMQTGKVAFDPDSRRMAFAIPRGAVGDGTGTVRVADSDAAELAGIFVFDPDELSITRVRGSEEVDRLAFPEFNGRDSVMFLLSSAKRPEPSRFRIVCCLR